MALKIRKEFGYDHINPFTDEEIDLNGMKAANNLKTEYDVNNMLKERNDQATENFNVLLHAMRV